MVQNLEPQKLENLQFGPMVMSPGGVFFRIPSFVQVGWFKGRAAAV